MNRGIYMTPGREEEWTLSVMHTEEAVDAYVQAFDEMAGAAARAVAIRRPGDLGARWRSGSSTKSSQRQVWLTRFGRTFE